MPVAIPAPFVDRHWDPAPLHSAFAAPVPQPALPSPVEAGTVEHERDAESGTRTE
jgi:hypothetical protein